MSTTECGAVINRDRADLRLTNQCQLLKISRLSLYCVPVGVNTNQGSQFKVSTWIINLTEANIKNSMDGRGRYLNNVFIDRLWRALKQEAIFLHELRGGFSSQTRDQRLNQALLL